MAEAVAQGDREIEVSQGEMLHLGMIIVGLPYSETRRTKMDEISGGSPYCARTIAAGDSSRMPSDSELAIVRF